MLDKSIIMRIKGMVNFRNIFIHEYVEIDSEKVYKVLKQCLGDFNDFARAIVKFLDKNGNILSK